MPTPCRLYVVMPLMGERATTVIEPSSTAHRSPESAARAPDESQRTKEVFEGVRDPWWGAEYVSVGPFPADFVRVDPVLYAVSDRLRALFEESGVSGLRFFPVRVNETTTMHLMVVRGHVEVNPRAFELQLLDGAEIGLHLRTRWMYVNPRVMSLLRKAKIPHYAECAVKAKST